MPGNRATFPMLLPLRLIGPTGIGLPGDLGMIATVLPDAVRIGGEVRVVLVRGSRRSSALGEDGVFDLFRAHTSKHTDIRPSIEWY